MSTSAKGRGRVKLVPDGEPRSFSDLAVRFAVSIGSTLGFVWLVIGIGDWIFDWPILANTGVVGAIFLCLVCLVASLVYIVVYLYVGLRRVASAEIMGGRDENPLTETLMTDLETAFREKRWEEVLKIGSVLSRPLWVTGKYRLRVRLGKLMEAAASYTYHPEIQAAALIDDLGWTKFMLGDVDDAQSNIIHGIQIAEASDNHYLAYKGARHLSGIAMESGHLIEAAAHLRQALAYAEKLPDGRMKQEAVAGLEVNQAQISMKERRWDEALAQLANAEQLYRQLKDNERLVKLYQYKGDVLFELGRLSAAKDEYRAGLVASLQESRKDGVLQNTIGVAKIAEREGDIDEARQGYREAAKLAQELGREGLAAELNSKATALESTSVKSRSTHK